MRVSQSLALWRFGLPIVKVCLAEPRYIEANTNVYSDANLFKNAFIEAQQHNQTLFSEEAAVSEPKEDKGEVEAEEEKKET